MMKTKKLVIITAILSMAECSLGQGLVDQYSWYGKHDIQLSIGLLSDYGVETGISTDGVVNIVGGDGFFGSIAYSYWAQDDLAIGVNVGVIGSEVSNSVNGLRISLEASSVVSVLFGIKYQPLKLSISESVRPFLFANAGPCFGSATRSFIGRRLRNEAHSETALASHFGLGAHFVLSRVFVAGLSGGYFLATDFDRPIGPQKNYSSPSFTLSFGILLGGGKKFRNIML
jgi:hypothetical protein